MPPASATLAPFPYDEDGADLILRSSDGVEFPVHRVILWQASPVFREMVKLLPARRKEDPLPVMECKGSGKILLQLLLYCYPVAKDKACPIEDIESAVLAARGFKMDLPVQFLRMELRRAVTDTGPVLFNNTAALHLWAIMSRLGFEEELQYAASQSTLPTLFDLKEEDLDHLAGVSAANYYRLREFHHRKRFMFTPWTFLSPQLQSKPSQKKGATFTDGDVAFCSKAPYSDMICRSSNGVEFATHRVILSMASPIFYNKIQVEERQLDINGAPLELVVEFDEDSKMLRDILDICCYHRHDHLPTSPAEIVELVKATKRYEMKRCSEILGELWKIVVKGNPLSASLLAAGAGLSELVKVAVHQLLHESSTVFSQYDTEMETTSAFAFHKLLVYHHACQNAVNEELRKAQRERPETCDTLSGHPALGSSPLPSKCPLPTCLFLQTFLHTLIAQDDKGPYSKVAAARSIFSEWALSGKPTSSHVQEEVAHSMRQLSESLPKRLEEAIQAVKLQL